MQPPTPGHPASKRSTRTFQPPCPGLTRLQDYPPRPGPGCLGVRWSPVRLGSLCPQARLWPPFWALSAFLSFTCRPQAW